MPATLRFLSPIHRAYRQIGIHLSVEVSPLELAPPEAHLLSYLRSYAPCAISVLHRVFGLRRTTLTSMLDRLERRGLVRRELCATDRRSFLVHLTAAGADLADVVQKPVDDLERRIGAELAPEDLRGFDRVMEAIARVTRVQVRKEE
ncbi:MAG: MarR family winged helix-turn-helix transcriptional regulator [Candidatus Eiseniibacteriota bacterium]